MRITAWAILLCSALPAFAQQSHKHDFRGGKFDSDVLKFYGQTPEKYFTQENEGLRLRYTGVGAAPSNFTAAVVWRFHARGDFTVTARYEILNVEKPKTGYGVGPELYLWFKNANEDAIPFSRVIAPNGDTSIQFGRITKNENGQRRPSPQDSKWVPATDASLRGAFRITREGNLLIASFAEGTDGKFVEIQRIEITNADVAMIRFAGISGGDPNAVLDMRMLEFTLQGKDLGYNGRDFATPAPKAVVPVADVAAPPAVPVQAPAAEVESARQAKPFAPDRRLVCPGHPAHRDWRHRALRAPSKACPRRQSGKETRQHRHHEGPQTQAGPTR